MKVLFLDFDGVLNSIQHSVLCYRKGETSNKILDEIACSNLQYILECVPECRIVVSSTWRKMFSLDWLKEHLRKYGVDSSKMIDCTPARFSSRKRGYEIQEWLDDYAKEHPEDPITHFAIVDDDCDMVHLTEKYLIQTNNNIGLTWGKAQDIVKLLGSSIDSWNPEKTFPYYILEAGRELSPVPPEDPMPKKPWETETVQDPGPPPEPTDKKEEKKSDDPAK